MWPIIQTWKREHFTATDLIIIAGYFGCFTISFSSPPTGRTHYEVSLVEDHLRGSSRSIRSAKRIPGSLTMKGHGVNVNPHDKM